MKEFKTPKGTIIPVLDLKGKDYLMVQWRLVWFREEHPDWKIKTEIIHHDSEYSVCRAEIYNEKNELMASAHKREDKAHFTDHLEKAEGSSIGRCLAYCGYGTQFMADELDEGTRIVDAPVESKKTKPPTCKCGKQMLFKKSRNLYYCPDKKTADDNHETFNL